MAITTGNAPAVLGAEGRIKHRLTEIDADERSYDDKKSVHDRARKLKVKGKSLMPDKANFAHHKPNGVK